jgi:hypothetical protein
VTTSECLVSREGAMLAPRAEMTWLALTSDQARILLRLVQEGRADITQRWSHGIWDGLYESLRNIDSCGGAYTTKATTQDPPGRRRCDPPMPLK